MEIVTRQVSGFSAEQVETLRVDRPGLGTPAAAERAAVPETVAINETPLPDVLGRQAERIDLVIGGRNEGNAPYGTSFEDVRRRIEHAEVHRLDGQGHLTHLEAPAELARLIDRLGAADRPGGASTGQPAGQSAGPSVGESEAR